MLKQKFKPLIAVVLALLLVAASIASGQSAGATGSNGPTPYAVSASGLTLPGDTTFPDNGHVNIKYTVDGGAEQSKGIHFESLNNQPSGEWIGKSYLPWSALGLSAPYCITWVQVSLYNEHFGEGGQAPVCTTPPAPTVKHEVGIYLYKKLDPTAPAAWPNSGLQSFIASKPGTEWFTTLPDTLPSNICGPGWGAQQDKVQYTVGPFIWPTTITYPESGFGPELYDSKHQELSELTTVPDCQQPSTKVTAVKPAVTKIEKCDTYGSVKTAITTGVTYTVSPANATEGTVTVSASANDGYVLEGYDGPWSYDLGNYTTCPPPPPTVQQCDGIDGTTKVTQANLQGFSFAETRSAGHYEFTIDGLRIYTDGVKPAEGQQDQNKVAAYKAIDVPLGQIGSPYLTYVSTFGIAPGLQLGVDKDNNGTWDGYIVSEPASYGDNWWSSKDFGISSGAGYTSYGTLNDYLAANPNAHVTSFGFSLGSGVYADGVLSSIVVACHEYTFGLAEVTPVKPDVTKIEKCGTYGSITPAVTTGVTYTVTPAGAKEGTVTVSASAIDGYVLTGYDGPWTYNLGKYEECPPPLVEVTPLEPAKDFSTKCETRSFVGIPAVTGVDYYLDDILVAAGEKAVDGGNHTVKAVAQKGYVLKEGATASWTFTVPPFKLCPLPPADIVIVKTTETVDCDMVVTTTIVTSTATAVWNDKKQEYVYDEPVIITTVTHETYTAEELKAAGLKLPDTCTVVTPPGTTTPTTTAPVPTETLSTTSSVPSTTTPVAYVAPTQPVLASTGIPLPTREMTIISAVLLVLGSLLVLAASRRKSKHC